MDDQYRLDRFALAQDRAGTYDRAVTELRAGRKQSHWMWFVFPQIAGLGSSPMAQEFAIRSVAEAQAYLAHPVLGWRLAECARILNAAADGVTAMEIFGSVDAMKLRSSMTLFAAAAPEVQTFSGGQAFTDVLARYFDGQPDGATLERL
jgi:uncharacterized protein (DUF1810 family)